MKRQYSEDYQPAVKRAKVSDFFGRTIEPMDIDPSVAWLLLANNGQTARRPILKAARGQARMTCSYTCTNNNPALALSTWIMKRGASSINYGDDAGSKRNKTGPIAKMMDVDNELSEILNKLHL